MILQRSMKSITRFAEGIVELLPKFKMRLPEVSRSSITDDEDRHLRRDH